jgi:hypothetical protein
VRFFGAFGVAWDDGAIASRALGRSRLLWPEMDGADVGSGAESGIRRLRRRDRWSSSWALAPERIPGTSEVVRVPHRGRERHRRGDPLRMRVGVVGDIA